MLFPMECSSCLNEIIKSPLLPYFPQNSGSTVHEGGGASIPRTNASPNVSSIAVLSFQGLGAQPPTPEWGTMLGSERNQVFSAPHLVFFPGIVSMITVLDFNLLGDGLRDALDPRLSQGGK